ncbi:hypothetical protein AAE478_007247 [Parahypoxylon ruwenzoriense]
MTNPTFALPGLLDCGEVLSCEGSMAGSNLAPKNPAGTNGPIHAPWAAREKPMPYIERFEKMRRFPKRTGYPTRPR